MNKIILNTNKLEFSNDSGVTKLIKRGAWGGTGVEVPCWNDFDSTYFQLSGNKIQYKMTPPVPVYATVYDGQIGNVGDTTINCCAITLNSFFNRGEYHHELRMVKKVTGATTYPITVDFYCDTYRLADAQTYVRYDGAPNGILVGLLEQSNNKYLLISSYIDNANYVISSLTTYPTPTVITVDYEPSPHSYYVI